MSSPDSHLATRAAVWIVVSSLIAASTVGCRSTTPVITLEDLDAAIERLGRPPSGDPAALYRLRVASSGGLRMGVLTSGDAGRLTVSEPFGSAVSLTAWSGSESTAFFDLREGCRLETADLELVLGVGAMPLPQAVRLLAGRLPATPNERLSGQEDGRILVEGRGWSARISVAPEPWRVVAVEESRDPQAGWRLDLSDHSLSVPGSIRVENRDGRWAELELVRLEWNDGAELPPLPDIPPCVLEPDA
jgi:hypothetical protein